MGALDFAPFLNKAGGFLRTERHFGCSFVLTGECCMAKNALDPVPGDPFHPGLKPAFCKVAFRSEAIKDSALSKID